MMGTRADFYLGRGTDATWLGSISWDGYPAGVDSRVLTATTSAEYGTALIEFLRERNDPTYGTEPWPWPWDTSRTTDYAYAFDPATGRVHAAHGDYWFPVDLEAPNCGEPMSLEDHAEECEVTDVAVLERHLLCAGHPTGTQPGRPFAAQPNEVDRVSYPDMSDLKGDRDYILGRSGMMVITSRGDSPLMSVEAPKSYQPSARELGEVHIRAATGITTELTPLPAGPGEAGYDVVAFEAAVRVREIERAAGVRDAEELEDADDVQAARAALAEPGSNVPLSDVLAQDEPGDSAPELAEAFSRSPRFKRDDFDAAVADAVGDFLTGTTPSEPDPETERAMREGFENNPAAMAYASGYAAGQAAGRIEVAATLDLGIVDALASVREWCLSRAESLRVDVPQGPAPIPALVLGDVATEIENRIRLINADGEAGDAPR